jgi:hypothetical protein
MSMVSLATRNGNHRPYLDSVGQTASLALAERRAQAIDNRC